MNDENRSIINDKLLALTTENEQLKNQLTQSQKENEVLQVDYANKLALMKVEYDNKELALRKEITTLRQALEVRDHREKAFEEAKNKQKMSINQIWDSITAGKQSE